MRILIAILSAILMASAALGAEPLSVNDAFRLSVDRDLTGSIGLHWRMPSGYYLYRQYLSVKDATGKDVPISIDPGVEKADPNFGTSEVYFGKADATVLSAEGTITLVYQGCQEHGLCYPPTKRLVDTSTLAVSEVPLFPSQRKGGASVWAPQKDVAQDKTTTVNALQPSENIVENLLSRGGIALLLVSFVGFGILIAFTPCVFPLYPILAATLARNGERPNSKRGAVLSGSYAFGLAAAFGIFGAIAAWTGENLQLALQSPLTVGLIGVIFAILGLSMFGLFELQLPSSLVARLSRAGGRSGSSPVSAAALGFSSAFIIGPCVTAPLAAALLYVARTGNPLLGAALLFALGLGKGVPLMMFGIAGSHALPRAGAWMETVKYVFGFVFFAFGIWTAEPILPVWLPIILWAALSMMVGVFLGALEFSKRTGTPLRMASQGIGLLLMVYAVVLIVGASAGASDPLRPLASLRLVSADTIASNVVETMHVIESKEQLSQQLSEASAAGKGSAVYFTADWCVSCRSIDRSILSDMEVTEALRPLTTLKVDLTNIGPAQRELMRDLEVVGPPTMIFKRPDGQQSRQRLIGEFEKDDVIEAARAAGSKT